MIIKPSILIKVREKNLFLIFYLLLLRMRMELRPRLPFLWAKLKKLFRGGLVWSFSVQVCILIAEPRTKIMKKDADNNNKAE